MKSPTEKHALRLLHRHFPRATLKWGEVQLVSINNTKAHGRVALFSIHRMKSPITGAPTTQYVICASKQSSNPHWFNGEPEKAMATYMAMCARKKP